MAMQKILTALESNEDGKHVWQVASRVAKNRNAESLIINVIKPATSVYTDLDFAPIAGYLTDWVKQAKAENLGFCKNLRGLMTRPCLCWKATLPPKSPMPSRHAS